MKIVFSCNKGFKASYQSSKPEPVHIKQHTILMMETARSSETLDQTTRRYNSEDSHSSHFRHFGVFVRIK
jgi:hypothetical protein